MTETRKEGDMLCYEEQLEALATLVEDWAIKRDKAVKGPFTSGDYVTYRLSHIFTPAGWRFTILDGPMIVSLNDANSYIRLVGRLTVRFANGQEAHQDDIGIWPLKATNARKGGVLKDTAPERYETAEKAARTDCLKNAARNIGTCFAPLTDLELLAHIKRQAHLKSVHGEIGASRSITEDIADLFGEDGNGGIAPAPKKNGNALRPADPETVKGWLHAKAAKKFGPASTEQVGLMVGMLNKMVNGDRERHSVLKWIWELSEGSSGQMTGAQVKATLDWIAAEKDPETKQYIPQHDAVEEAKSILRQALVDEGQTEFEIP